MHNIWIQWYSKVISVVTWKTLFGFRCFTFGIGSGASTALVRGLARAGNGTAEFIQSGERLQPKVWARLLIFEPYTVHARTMPPYSAYSIIIS